MTERWRRRLLWGALGLLIAVGWWGTLHAPFVYDDKIEVIGNRTIRMFEHWREIGAYNRSRPLLVYSYAWNFDRFRFDPVGYHVTNLIIHFASAVVALGMVESVGRLFRRPQPLWRAFVVVALWAVHPMVTESVTYTTGRSESLCALFSFATVACWCRALLAERDGVAHWPWRVGSVGLFLLAVLSKEVAVVLPLVLVSLDTMSSRSEPSPRPRAARRWLWAIPFLSLIGVAVALRAQQASSLIPVEVERPMAVQLATSAEVWLHYVRLWFVPVGQTLFHAQPDVDPLSLRGVLAVGGWGALMGVGLWLGRRSPVAGLALLTAALTIAPSTSLPMLKEHMAEHRAHQAGLWLLVALGLGPAWTVRRGRSALAVLAIGVCVVLTRARNTVWSSEVALWEEATRLTPESAEAWYGLGDAQRFADDFSAAAVAYERATELNPSNLDAWNNLGIAWAEVGDVSRAKRAWRDALEVRPSYCKAHNNLGSLAYRFKDWEEARGELQSTLAYCPTSVVAHYLLGNIYYGPRRDVEKALFHYEAVAALDPYFDHVDVAKDRILELTW